MELLTKTREQLEEIAEKLNLKVTKKMPDSELIEKIETEAIRRTVEMEEKVRLRLQEESKVKRELAEIQAEAAIRGVTIEIPPNPTTKDTLKLKKKLNMMIKEPKPSPETLAILKSKKVYALFRNLQQKDEDVTFNVGGKHTFHLWPGKIHVLPEWIIGYCRRKATEPDYIKRIVKTLETAKVDEMVERSVRTNADEQRWTFEILGDAPQNSSFGIVLDEKLLSKLKQPV